MKAINHNNDEFEVTAADEAMVSPLGQEAEFSEDTQRATLRENLKDFIRELPDDGLPRGYWDAWTDEGVWEHDTAKYPHCAEDHCYDTSHLHCTVLPDPAKDDVFIRLATMVDGGISNIWDVEVFTRRGSNDGFEAQPEVNGEEITPEQCLTDLGALLAVFRLFVSQGRI
jgi:hypothetical protein